MRCSTIERSSSSSTSSISPVVPWRKTLSAAEEPPAGDRLLSGPEWLLAASHPSHARSGADHLAQARLNVSFAVTRPVSDSLYQVVDVHRRVQVSPADLHELVENAMPYLVPV